MATRIEATSHQRPHSALAVVAIAFGASLAGCDASSDPVATGGDEPRGPDNPLTGEEQGGLCRGRALPADHAFVADGLCVRAVAENQGKLRQLTFASNGDLIGVTSSGRILRYRDSNEDGMFAGTGEVVTIATTGGDNGNNSAFDADETYLYAGTPDGVGRFRYSTSSNALGASQRVVTGQPSDGTHSLHTVHVYDGWLYVHSGSEGNAFAPALPDYDMNRSVLKRFNLADFDGTAFRWEDGEVYYAGIRNMVGFTRNERDGMLYGVVNGLDDLVYQGQDVHLSNPGDDLIRMEQGRAHGYPYCFTAEHILAEDAMVLAGTQLAGTVEFREGEPAFENPHDDAWCAENSTIPLTLFPAHSAPLEIIFVEGGGALPEEWTGSALVALHGSWDTSPSVGHQVVRVTVGEDGSMTMPTASPEGASFDHEVIFGGAKGDGLWGWASGTDGEYPVRPVGLAISPTDGALYVSSDNASVFQGVDAPEQGVIYRIARIP